jgi:hypothetical protein
MSENKLCATTCSDNMSKSSDFSNCSLSIGTWAAKSWRDVYFESRKKRPQEKGRKKRKKGKRNPPDLLWNSMQARNCNILYLQYRN